MGSRIKEVDPDTEVSEVINLAERRDKRKKVSRKKLKGKKPSKVYNLHEVIE